MSFASLKMILLAVYGVIVNIINTLNSRSIFQDLFRVYA